MAKTKHTRLLIIPFLVICYLHLSGIDIYVKQVNLPGDIIQARINTLLPDSTGYLWLATSTGLYRWDGLRAINYPVSGTQLPINVTALAEDKEGVIWAGCEDGSIYYSSGRELVLWRNPDTAAFSKINDLLFDAGGNLWWGTNGSGLFLFNGDQIQQITTDDGMPDNYIYSLERGYYGEVWASTDRGIAVCKSWEGIHQVNSYEKKDGLDDDIVRIVQKDAKGNIWLGFHEGGVCYYDKTQKTFRQPENPNQLRLGRIDAIARGSNSLWIVDKSHGLLFLNDNTNPQFEKAELHGEVLPVKIKTINFDQMGNLWILGKEGLFVSSAGAFVRITKKSNYDVTAANAVIYVDKHSTWLVEDNSILELNNGKPTRFLSGIINKTSIITSAKTDDFGNFWLGTFGDGVIIFNPNTKKHRIISESDGLVNNSVLNISIRDNNVWIATLGGASHLNAEKAMTKTELKVESFDKEHGLGNNFIYCICQDSKGNVWFGTDGNGLVKYDGKGFSFFDETSGLGDKVVYSVVEDADGELWLNTSSSGVQRFDGKTFTNLMASKESNSNILSLACSGDFILILTENGLDILNKNTGSIFMLNEELDIRKLGAELNNAYTHERFVCFATDQGIIRINTERLEEFETTPRLDLDKILVNLEAADMIDNAKLSVDENKLVFEYTGFWYLAPAKVHYMTRLVGYDPDWQTTYDRRAVYASLFPGEYHFELKAMLDHVSLDNTPLSISFQILTPFYARWWFILIASLAIVFSILWLIRYREKRLKEKESRQKEKLEFEFQTLKNQINPHFLFNSFSTLIYMIEEEPKVATEYAEKLSDFFRNILEVRDNELIPLKEELRMVRDYSFIQHKRFGDNFSLDIQLDDRLANTLIPPLTLQLLTENAIKHNIISRNKPLKVKLHNDLENIIVENNLQEKKVAESSTGLGLKNISERYLLISNKVVRVEKTNTEFKIYLPIIT